MFANVDPDKGYLRASRPSSLSGLSPVFVRERRKTNSAFVRLSTCELMLDDCEVPEENVLGEVGRGYKIAIEALNEGRIGIERADARAGGGRLRQDKHRLCMREHVQFGKAIAEFQGSKVPVNDARRHGFEAARLLVLPTPRG